jgi:hypothetical protein
VGEENRTGNYNLNKYELTQSGLPPNKLGASNCPSQVIRTFLVEENLLHEFDIRHISGMISAITLSPTLLTK